MKKEPKISSLIDKAIFDYNLIEPGDKILVGASGGKDSTLLLEYFSNRKKRPNCNFCFEAVHIQSDFSPEFPSEISEFLKKRQIPFKIIKVNILKRVKENEKMSCYWCATQRRTELLNYALKNGFNKIALGHHLDDILETFLMNMLEKGNLSTMIPKMSYKKWNETIIRPLCYVSEKRIIEYIAKNDYKSYICTCSYENNSARKTAKKLLEQLTQGDENKKQKIFNALKNVQKEYLL